MGRGRRAVQVDALAALLEVARLLRPAQLRALLRPLSARDAELVALWLGRSARDRRLSYRELSESFGICEFRAGQILRDAAPRLLEEARRSYPDQHAAAQARVRSPRSSPLRRAARAASRPAVRRSGYKPRAKVAKTCRVCKQVFFDYPYHGLRTCLGCRMHGASRLVELVCLECGKKFCAYPSEKRLFCGRKCSTTYRKHSGPHRGGRFRWE